MNTLTQKVTFLIIAILIGGHIGTVAAADYDISYDLQPASQQTLAVSVSTLQPEDVSVAETPIRSESCSSNLSLQGVNATVKTYELHQPANCFTISFAKTKQLPIVAVVEAQPIATLAVKHESPQLGTSAVSSSGKHLGVEPVLQSVGLAGQFQSRWTADDYALSENDKSSRQANPLTLSMLQVYRC